MLIFEVATNAEREAAAVKHTYGSAIAGATSEVLGILDEKGVKVVTTTTTLRKRMSYLKQSKNEIQFSNFLWNHQNFEVLRFEEVPVEFREYQDLDGVQN